MSLEGGGREGGREEGQGRGGEGREGGWGREGWREGGEEGGREGREGGRLGGWGREEGRERGRGGMTVIHILMAPQYLNNNHVTYYVITQVGVYAEQQWYVITSDVTWTPGQSE